MTTQDSVAPKRSLTADQIDQISHRDKFCRYGATKPESRDIGLDELIQIRERQGGGLFANLEYSGCESCYVEVARWIEPGCEKPGGWRRFAFLKMMDVYISDSSGEPIDIDEKTLGQLIVRAINDPGGVSDSFVHSLKDYGDGDE